jgi:glucarate dehydratase
MRYEGGAIAVPTGPGLGVKLDYDKLGEYRELYRRMGNYADDHGSAASGLDADGAERSLGRSE